MKCMHIMITMGIHKLYKMIKEMKTTLFILVLINKIKKVEARICTLLAGAPSVESEQIKKKTLPLKAV